MYPVIADYHDEFYMEVKEEHIEQAKQLVYDTWDLTNNELGGIIKHKGDPEIITSFAETKCEEKRGIL